jgi:very-short-patch-repair endonuclease
MRRRARLGNRPFDKPGAHRGKLALARAMRAMPTDGEAALWAVVRDGRIGGWKFRRQHVIAGYVVDFYCAPLRFVVEVDGPVHLNRRQEDQERDAVLFGLGLSVVRLNNDDVLERLGTVVHELTARCERIAHDQGLSLPRPAGEGRVGAVTRVSRCRGSERR